MKILEYKCNSCSYVFTRVVENDKFTQSNTASQFDGVKTKNKKEKCSNCGGKAVLEKELGIEKNNWGCSGCEECHSKCKI